MNECMSETLLLLRTDAPLLLILNVVKLVQQCLNLHSHNLFFIQLGLEMHRKHFFLKNEPTEKKRFFFRAYTAMKINLAKYSLNSPEFKDGHFCGSETKLSKGEH